MASALSGQVSLSIYCEALIPTCNKRKRQGITIYSHLSHMTDRSCRRFQTPCPVSQLPLLTPLRFPTDGNLPDPSHYLLSPHSIRGSLWPSYIIENLDRNKRTYQASSCVMIFSVEIRYCTSKSLPPCLHPVENCLISWKSKASQEQRDGTGLEWWAEPGKLDFALEE